MGSECDICGKIITDDERLSDRFGVAVEYHKECIARLRAEVEWLRGTTGHTEDCPKILTRLERAERVVEAASVIEDMVVVPELLGFHSREVAQAAIDRFRQALTAWQEARDEA